MPFGRVFWWKGTNFKHLEDPSITSINLEYTKTLPLRMISRQRCQLSFHRKLFNAFFVRHILPQIQQIDPTTQNGVSFLFQFLNVGCNQDSARDLLKRQQTSSNTSPCGNSIQQKQRQDSCSSTKMWVSDQGTWCYFLNILHPNSFQPWKQKNKDRLVKLCQSWRYSSKWYSTSILSCRRTWARSHPLFLGVMFFLCKELGHKGEFQMWCSLKIVNLGWNLQDSSPVRIFGKPWG